MGAQQQQQLTGRALLAGCGIGVMLAAANVYTGLKISIIDGGSITAALLGFTIFATFTRLARRPYTAIENNITQTTAASAAIMGYAAGMGGPIPAMDLSGTHFPVWALVVWGASLGVIGIVAAALLRRKLIVDDALPFPTGNATGNLIETMFGARATALRRARLLIGAALFAAAFTWFRDGRPKVIPAMTMFGISVGGMSLNAVSFGMNWSPLVMSTGVMMGMRAALSMFIGAAVGWGLLSPWLVSHHVVATLDFSSCLAWLVWPGLGMLMAGSLLPLLMDWRPIVRAVRDLGGLAVARRRRDPAGARGGRAGAALMVAGLAGVVVVARGVFGFHVPTILLVLLFALAMAVVSSRATGETDLAPVGAVGTVTQLLFSRCGAIGSMLFASVAFGASTQAAQTLWALKAGQKLHAAPRPQLVAQLIGALLGAAVVAPVYVILMKAYGIGTESLPAPSAISVKATAEALRGGLSTLPPYATLAGAVGLAVGAMLALLARGRWARFCPSPAAMGIAMLIPPALAVAGLAGVLLARVAQRLRPDLDDDAMTSIAAGGLAGESVMGVVIAGLVLLGLV
ncbi:MAG TPA: OPT family oligopeptide transporter [Polyangia bacterium]|nr:OPT family oligopeptide transporter [Polyangia bacterium]